MDNKSIAILRAGGVGVLLTDTLYGLVGQALRKETVARIYAVKGRNNKKPLIVLISSPNDLKKFGIQLDSKLKKTLKNFWPGPMSVIMPCPLKQFEYLHRGTNTLAFRVSQKKILIALLKKTGPLVAPSANPEGLPPARTIAEAKKYFGDVVDFYINEGKSKSKPSTIVDMTTNSFEIVRK